MIDPVSIGVAFAVAQKSVGYIKQAVALGKDINSLYGQFARFFENSDVVHSTSSKIASGELTDGQIRALSIQIAMQSKALRDAEKQLKELLIYTGNKDIWDEMMRERVRMYKERAAAEKKRKEDIARAHAAIIDRVLFGTSALAICAPLMLLGVSLLPRL